MSHSSYPLIYRQCLENLVGGNLNLKEEINPPKSSQQQLTSLIKKDFYIAMDLSSKTS